MKVAIIMGSASDMPVMEGAIKILQDFGVETQVDIVSAHRTPSYMMRFATSAHQIDIGVIIAGAGGVMTDWAGEQLTLASNGDVLASGDPGLHGATLGAITKT